MIRPWRRALQWLGALLFFALPFLRWDGVSLLRLDLPSWTLFFFGRQLRLEEFYLLGLILLGLVFLFLLLTMILGRVWCGWLCPQTWLNNLAEWTARRLGLRVDSRTVKGAWFRRLPLHLLYLILALLCGAALVWYFVEPREYWRLLRAGQLGPWPLGFTLVLALLFYLDLAFIRRLACREFCPYGRFQTILIDRGTLTLGLTADHGERCLDCRACLRVCPTGIDIRRGLQVECINCGNCRDACRRVMARVQPGRSGPVVSGQGAAQVEPGDQSGLIEYRFGIEGAGWRALFTPRLLLVGLVFCLLVGAFFLLAGQRQAVGLQVARLVTAAPVLAADGRLVQRFSAQVANRTVEAAEYRLVVRWAGEPAMSPAGEAGPTLGEGAAILPGRSYLPLLGQGGDFFRLDAGERRRLIFAVALPAVPAAADRQLVVALQDRSGREQGAVQINIPSTSKR